MNTSAKIAGLPLFFCLLLTSSAFSQGVLTPPGPPGPTMKTLEQVEPRVPIDSLPFSISQSGSYYFTKSLNFTAASGDAISVTALDVSIDLMGFTLSSSSGVTGSGIAVGTNVRCVVKNGTIRGTTTVSISGTVPNRTWTVTPGGFDRGIDALTAGNCRFLDLTLTRCRTYGVEANANSLTERCVASSNGVDGVKTGTVTDCAASNNGDDGIDAQDGAVTGCTAFNNGGTGIYNANTVASCAANSNGSEGIDADSGSVSNCAANSNQGSGILSPGGSVANCTAGSNQGIGVSATLGSVTNCIVILNEGSGISCDFGSVTNSNARSNGDDGISCSSGVVAFCKASNNNQNNNGSVDIDAAGATRTGNNPTP